MTDYNLKPGILPSLTAREAKEKRRKVLEAVRKRRKIIYQKLVVSLLTVDGKIKAKSV